MPSNLTEIRIFIASPGDMTPERDRLIKIIHDFNQPQRIIARLGLRVQALDWRQHFVPKMGLPEEILLQQLPPDTWNIFVGLMWQRFGSDTGSLKPDSSGLTFDSGTLQEFTTAYDLWKKHGRPEILFYRCKRELDPDLDLEQYQKVRDFLNNSPRAARIPVSSKNSKRRTNLRSWCSDIWKRSCLKSANRNRRM